MEWLRNRCWLKRDKEGEDEHTLVSSSRSMSSIGSRRFGGDGDDGSSRRLLMGCSEGARNELARAEGRSQAVAAGTETSVVDDFALKSEEEWGEN